MLDLDTTTAVEIFFRDMLGNKVVTGDTIVYPSGRYARRLIVAEILSIRSQRTDDGYTATVRVRPIASNVGDVSGNVVVLKRWDNMLKVAAA